MTMMLLFWQLCIYLWLFSVLVFSVPFFYCHFEHNTETTRLLHLHLHVGFLSVQLDHRVLNKSQVKSWTRE